MKILEQKKNSLAAHLLIKSSRLFFRHSIEQINQYYKIELSENHYRVFPYIEYGGSSITEIAKKMGISKQAVSKLIQSLIEKKILYSSPSPHDKREKIIKFKAQKESQFLKGLEYLETQEKTFNKILGGDKELLQFKAALLKIQNHYQEKLL